MIHQIVAGYLANVAHGLAHLSEPAGKAQAVSFLLVPGALLILAYLMAREAARFVVGGESDIDRIEGRR